MTLGDQLCVCEHIRAAHEMRSTGRDGACAVSELEDGELVPCPCRAFSLADSPGDSPR